MLFPSARRSLLVVAILTSIIGVTAPSSLPTCILQCINSGLTAVDCTFPDPNSCFCGNPGFVTSVEQCLESSCTPSEQEAGVLAMNSACDVGHTTGVYSFPPISSSMITSLSVDTNSALPLSTTQPPVSTTTSSTTPTTSTRPGSAVTNTRLQIESVVIGAIVILGTVIGHALLR